MDAITNPQAAGTKEQLIAATTVGVGIGLGMTVVMILSFGAQALLDKSKSLYAARMSTKVAPVVQSPQQA